MYISGCRGWLVATYTEPLCNLIGHIVTVVWLKDHISASEQVRSSSISLVVSIDMPIKTLMQLMAIRREHTRTIAFHKQQIAIARKKFKDTIHRHNKAVAKQKARNAAQIARQRDRNPPISSSTIRRWNRAVRHGDISGDED